MQFKIRRISQFYVDVQVTVNGTTVDLGLHTEAEREALAATLREAAEELHPTEVAQGEAE